MPALGSIKRRDLIKYFRGLGFNGPYSGGKHQFMIRGDQRIRIPNPHKSDIGINLLSRILKEAGIEKEEWERL